MNPPRSAREYVRSEHRALVETTVDCADAVAAGWDGEATADRSRVVPPLEAALRRSGVVDALPAVIAGAVEAAGFSLAARPVAGPPYVAMTSQGPLLRATVPEGRLVVTLAVFEIERGEPTRYRRAGETPETVVRAVFRT